MLKNSKIYLLAIAFLISIGVTYLNFLRYESFKVQYIVYKDGSDTNKISSRDMNFINSIKTEYPSLGLFTMPLSSQKAAYLLAKDSVISGILLHEEGAKRNPYLMYSEGQLADIYFRVGDFEKYFTRCCLDMDKWQVYES